jgi:hypothetical protein
MVSPLASVVVESSFVASSHPSRIASEAKISAKAPIAKLRPGWSNKVLRIVRRFELLRQRYSASCCSRQ